jgi:hypothetical protein
MFFLILPYIEQNAVYDAGMRSTFNGSAGLFPVGAPQGRATWAGDVGGGKKVSQVSIPTYLCPSDPTVGSDGFPMGLTTMQGTPLTTWA